VNAALPVLALDEQHRHVVELLGGRGGPRLSDGTGSHFYYQEDRDQDRDDLAPGFDDRATSWGSTILHELGHLVGLGHVDDRGELMAVTPGEGPVRFGPGDLRGLAAIGADHGCVDVPRPQPVEVVPPSG
jgi:hypothetical protein